MSFPLPSRPSDCGPSPAPPATWDVHVDNASDDLHGLTRLHRDDLAVERKLRLERIKSAIESLEAARDCLEAV